MDAVKGKRAVMSMYSIMLSEPCCEEEADWVWNSLPDEDRRLLIELEEFVADLNEQRKTA